VQARRRPRERRPGSDPTAAAIAGALRLLADVRNLAAGSAGTSRPALYGVDVPALVEVPLLGGDVHDLEGLDAIAQTTLLTGRTR
jgi:hypothetical protein